MGGHAQEEALVLCDEALTINLKSMGMQSIEVGTKAKILNDFKTLPRSFGFV
jgi:hypothetical protein